jgi:hypothetical protein
MARARRAACGLKAELGSQAWGSAEARSLVAGRRVATAERIHSRTRSLSVPRSSRWSGDVSRRFGPGSGRWHAGGGGTANGGKMMRKAHRAACGLWWTYWRARLGRGGRRELRRGAACGDGRADPLENALPGGAATHGQATCVPGAEGESPGWGTAGAVNSAAGRRLALSDRIHARPRREGGWRSRVGIGRRRNPSGGAAFGNGGADPVENALPVGAGAQPL